MSALAARLEAIAGPDSVRAWQEHARSPEIPLVLPADAAALQAAVEMAARDRLRLVPLGLGSKLCWARPAARADFALSTRRLRGVVSYEPGDGTLSARAGTTMAELAAELRRGGHALTPDVPAPGGATLGGVVAAGQSGFDRLGRGPTRHAILGMRVITGEGEPARSGGQLVKNVTGYDLHRLYCGSHGTLCVIAEVSLRLHPAPEREALAAVAAPDLARALEWSRVLSAPPARPRALLARSDGAGAWTLVVHVAGRAAVVADELALVRRRLAEIGAPEPSVTEGPGAVELRERERDAELLTDRWPELRLTAMPSAIRAAVELADRAARELGLAPRWRVHPRIAEATARLAPDDRADELDPGRARELARRLNSSQATVRWLRAPLDCRADFAISNRPPDARAAALSERLQRALDPLRVFAGERLPASIA